MKWRVVRLLAWVMPVAMLPACGSGPGGPGPVTAAPTIHSITPNTGTLGGGAEVTIRGSNFASGATIEIGGRPATDVIVQTSELITAKTPSMSAAGGVEVTVTTSAGTGRLMNGFSYVAPGFNTPPIITALSVQGPRAGQPADFADLREVVTLSANVVDTETPAEQLEYQWTASLGSIGSGGATVTWEAPAVAVTPVSVLITLRVIERYGPAGAGQHETTRTRTISLHDSTREVGEMARRFLTEFSKPQTNQDWRDVMRDFDLDGGVCPDPRTVADERQEVQDHYRQFVMHAYNIGAASVAFNFGGRCVVRNRPGDACVAVPVLWDSTNTQTNVRASTKGTDYLTAAYSSAQTRWRLCSSDLPSSSQTLSGHSFYTR